MQLPQPSTTGFLAAYQFILFQALLYASLPRLLQRWKERYPSQLLHAPKDRGHVCPVHGYCWLLRMVTTYVIKPCQEALSIARKMPPFQPCHPRRGRCNGSGRELIHPSLAIILFYFILLLHLNFLSCVINFLHTISSGHLPSTPTSNQLPTSNRPPLPPN